MRIGARTRHRDVESATDLRGTLDVLLDAAPLISDPLIRNMGTVGGSICHADPAGDWGAVMLAVGAEFVRQVGAAASACCRPPDSSRARSPPGCAPTR